MHQLSYSWSGRHLVGCRRTCLQDAVQDTAIGAGPDEHDAVCFLLIAVLQQYLLHFDVLGALGARKNAIPVKQE